jgi:uncharacterized damage-inducible protein DinB
MPQSEKAQLMGTFERELATTLKVLRAFPADKHSYTPHERSSTALGLAWTFVIENQMAMMGLKGPLQFGAGMPKAPATMGEVITAYETSARDYMKALAATPDSRLDEKIAFPSGPGKMGEMRVMEFLWMMFLDSIHHRGQLSTYIRPAGGKVPSIYGPSGDEKWT